MTKSSKFLNVQKELSIGYKTPAEQIIREGDDGQVNQDAMINARTQTSMAYLLQDHYLQLKTLERLGEDIGDHMISENILRQIATAVSDGQRYLQGRRGDEYGVLIRTFEQKVEQALNKIFGPKISK